MVNDENDKWSDNGDLPINTIYNNPKQLDKKSKKIIINSQSINNQSNGEKEISEEQINEMSNKNLLINDSFSNTKNLVQTNNDNQIKEELSKDIISKVALNNKFSKLKEESKEFRYFKEFGTYIKNLDSAIGQLTKELKTFTDAKSWEALSRGNLDVRRYANYYDVHGTITTAGASDPNDFDSPVYNVERVFEYLERFSEIIYVTNDGTDLLHVIVSHGGRTRFSTESPIYPKEIKCFFNIYEIRLRSPTTGLPYRVTEYCLHELSEISSIPIEKANLHNQALPAANTNWLVTDITPSNSPTTFVIEVAVSIAGNFSAVITKGGNAQTVTFNVIPGPALVAGGVYIFDLLVHSGDSINFTYSATGGTIQIFRVQEFDSATA